MKLPVPRRLLLLAATAMTAACAGLLSLDDVSYGGRGTGSDGGVEGGPGGAGEAGADAPACPHLFCESFDDGAGYARWAGAPNPVGGNGSPAPTAGIDSDASTSAPSSFWVRADLLEPHTSAFLTQRFPVVDAGAITCAFDVRVEQPPRVGEDGLLAFAVEAPSTPGDYVVTFIAIPKGGTWIEEELPDATPAPQDGPGLGSGTWQHVVVTLSPQTRTLRVNVGGVPVLVPLALLPSDVTAYRLQLGLVYGHPYDVDGAVPVAFRFDSVTCDLP